MAKLVVIGRKHMRWAKLIGGIALLACAAMLLWRVDEVRPAMSSSDSGKERTIHLVTGEFKSTGPDGQEIEAYRWDPGTIYVKKGERIKLSIFGIDGLNVKGEVKKGQETVVSFKADKPGIYRIICLTHPDIAHHGPMIGYIVVDK